MSDEVEVITTDKQLEDLAKQAMSKLAAFFRKAKHESGDVGEIRVATSVLSAWTRQNQVRVADRSATLAIAKELSLSKEQFAQVVKETMPQLGITRMLGPAQLPIQEENERLREDNQRKSAQIVELQNQIAQPR